jgi:hypothetical protein
MRDPPQEPRLLFPPVPPYASVDYAEYTPPPLPSDTFVLFGETHPKLPVVRVWTRWNLLFLNQTAPHPHCGPARPHSTQIPPLHVSSEYDRADGKIDLKRELTKLHTRLTLAIHDLLQTLVDDPQSYARRVEQCGSLFRNMQYLLSLLREKQATDATLVDLLRHEIEKKRACLSALDA